MISEDIIKEALKIRENGFEKDKEISPSLVIFLQHGWKVLLLPQKNI
ncbi:hypothetical protein TREPR_2163 [Treponema primitia ZAS-2]|uniref:Uncharacterized protein n=1 Tax=Treponema primitia (strain ATCC BAA-887 / DSM 12427 / ZAS-2) TaxID=545694 RepID=F5YJ37_TREPZ|nr:hypothetical protein [Treponema primitia]AEF85598.1 hypothetical protein TREPR_2163 [Treponema primitia ZAS-2]